MKGDFTRKTFDADKHYSSVRFQQGRVHLDADLNEVQEIQQYRERTALTDVIGAAGVPYGSDGFDLSFTGAIGSQVLHIAGGRFYIDGLLVENEASVTFAAQPHYPGAAMPTTPGVYVAYLCAWERHLTWLDDEDMREVALGGADTCTRTQVVWQVRLVQVSTSAYAGENCSGTYPAYTTATAASTGTLKARTKAVTTASDPCLGDVDGGYRSTENHLYRVEIHTAGTETAATYKWSRDNGIVVATWSQAVAHTVATDPFDVTVSTLGRDDALSFEVGQTVELSGDTLELNRQPGRLCTITAITDTTLTLTVADGGGVVNIADFGTNPVARRWDGTGTVQAAAVAWVELGSERIEVQFGTGGYHSGDWWLIPARTITGEIEWPVSGGPVAMAPHGPEMHYARLGVYELQDLQTDAWAEREDCRPQFPAAVDLYQMQYAGGAAQRGPQGVELGQSLQVTVSRGRWPVAGASVKFTPSDAGSGLVAMTSGGTFATSQTVTTDAFGLAKVYWKLGNDAKQTVKAELLNDAGTVIGTPVRYGATLDPTFWIVAAYLDRPNAAGGGSTQFPVEVAPAMPPLSPLETLFAWDNLWQAAAWKIVVKVRTTTTGLRWYEGNFPVTWEPDLTSDTTGMSLWRLVKGQLASPTKTSPDPSVGVEEWTLEWTPSANARGTINTTGAGMHRVRVRIPINYQKSDNPLYVWQAGDMEFTFLIETTGQ